MSLAPVLHCKSFFIMEEIRKDIEGYEGLYQVSNMGRLKGLDRKEKIFNSLRIRKGRIIVGQLCKGYYRYHISRDGKRKQKFIHRLVAQTFITNPENKPFINHKNGIRNDNRIENLEWCTPKENVNHSLNVLLRKGNRLGHKGILNSFSKKVNQYTLDGKFIKTWNCMRDVSRYLGINVGWLCSVCKGRGKSAGGFKRKYF